MSDDKRVRCDGCCFLQGQCVCRWIPSVTTRMSILVLQDPKEAQHAKNTVALLTLCLPSVERVVLTSVGALSDALKEKDPQKWRLVFPSDRAVALESMESSRLSEIEGLIFVDATWRKAKKLYFSERLLQVYDAVCFSSAPMSMYTIRKSPSAEFLSTLEACAYAIEQVSGENMAPLRAFMSSAQEWQWRKQPSDHRCSK
ncbi:tRNA-uridine aminocarboxypropyltransferase [Marinomonas sp. IMCC 4694]|uniref:tRNA-uridine aminocarboxypropyltransferase n=1 Tax=Marinomonas sp. IMCC 4694 TaxID=2605432 RepID=UPI0011E65B97|nr:tRNA-uridine aminocarboxypropyltransferase [Marinomonas sp. IMCC 4694]TYL48184.1 DTW domain-containing protein [Marinomonas sp. IMCC 4694]